MKYIIHADGSYESIKIIPMKEFQRLKKVRDEYIANLPKNQTGFTFVIKDADFSNELVYPYGFFGPYYSTDHAKISKALAKNKSREKNIRGIEYTEYMSRDEKDIQIHNYKKEIEKTEKFLEKMKDRCPEYFF